jgi:protein O-mannosyl-transferase
MGVVLEKQGRSAEALNYFLLSAQNKPNWAPPLLKLAEAHVNAGRANEAMQIYEALLKRGPEWHHLYADTAQILASQSRTAEAILHYREALKSNPDWPDVLNSLAWLLATDASATNRNGNDAVSLAAKASSLSGHKNSRYLGTLAAALAEVGRFNEAIEACDKAENLARSQGDAQMQAVAKMLNDRFRLQQPFHNQ